MGRFVRRTSSSAAKVFALTVAIATLLGSGGLTLLMSGFVAATKVDPAVYYAVMHGGSVAAYVATEGQLPDYLRCVKVWSFGSLHVCKTSVDKDLLAKLISDERVVSVYSYTLGNGETLVFEAWMKNLVIRDYIDTAERVDIDNVYHEAYGPYCGRGVIVAVIDTGIDYTHPDFYDEDNKTIIVALVSVLYEKNGHPLVWIPYVNGSMQDLLEYDKKLWSEYGEPAFLDVNGHGTHVAGIIAGRGRASNGKYRGIAPCTKLVIVKAFNRKGGATIDAALDALQWVYDNAERFNISILNLSWGAAYASDGRDPVSLAVDRIYLDKHVWVFAAAGNEGNYPYTVIIPAVARHAIAVGAWDPYTDKLAPFSSLGPTVDLRMKPDIVAAGVMTVAPASRYVNWSGFLTFEDGYYVALSGTSMATPAAAGCAAVFIEYWRTWFNGASPSLADFIHWEEVNGKRINIIKDFITGWGAPIAPHS